MKDDLWIKRQLKEIEQIQKVMTAQQSKAEDSLSTLKKESALVLKKIGELSEAIDTPHPPAGGGFVSPELESQIKRVSVQALAIDKKVSDTSCPE